MRWRLVAALLVVSVLVPVEASAAVKRIGRASASGLYASAIARGSVDRPRALYAKVTSTPKQRVDVYWTVLCTRGDEIRSDGGDFSAVTPVRRSLRIPFGSRPDDCDLTAHAFLDDRGRIVLVLLARV